jgi:hypothetical protein
MTPLPELKRICEAATNYKWFKTQSAIDLRDDIACSESEGTIAQNARGKDAEFIATFNPHLVARLLSDYEKMREALEYVSCTGMDDGDFYAEEFITEGTISMANRARKCLSSLQSFEGEK